MGDMKFKANMNYLLSEGGIGIILVLLFLFFAVTTPHFASFQNISNIFTQISINTIISVGMTFVILLGGIDLSVGSLLALCSVAAGMVMSKGTLSPCLSIFIAVFLSIVIGMFVGLANGAISEKWKIHSFIVTLGMLNITRGMALQVSNSRTFFDFPAGFNSFGNINIVGLPIIFVIALLLVILGQIVLTRTVFGRMLIAIGNNEESVRLSGHNTALYKVLAFVICGASVGIAAIMYMLRLNIASPILGVGFELNAIAAVVIGGTSMNGGKGSLLGTFLGACIMGVLNNGLLLIGLGDFARQIVTGLIIILAVILDRYRNSFSARLREA